MLKAFEEEALTELQTKLDSLDPREKGRQYLIQREQEAEEKYAPPGVEFFKSLIPGQIEPAPEGAPDAISSDLGLIDPVELAVDLTPVGMAAGIGLGALKKVDKALPSVSGFTSKLEDVIRQKMGGKATAEEIGAMVKQAGVKQEELEDIAFEQWLQGTENQLFNKQRKSSIEPSTSVQTPKIKKEEVLEYLKSERPELDVVEYPDRKGKEALDFYHNKMMSAAAEVDTEYAALIKKYKTHSNKDVAFKESDLHRHVTDARFMAEQGSSFKENGSLQILTLGLDLDPQEVISDVDRLAKKQLAYEEASKKYNFASANTRTAKWARYSLAGHGIGENYREYVFTAPFTDRTRGREIFKSEGHWPNVEDPVYHIRAQDLTDKDGDKLLNVDEIQSDVHQYGQKFGYKKREMTEDEREKAIQILRENGAWRSSGIRPTNTDIVNQAMYLPDEEFAKIQPIFKEAGLAVDLPFKKTWHEQAMRRMIKEALDSGKDGVSWTAGSVQAKRAGQDLGEVTSIAYDPARYHLSAYKGDDNIFDRNVPLQKLSQYVGSGIAKQFKDGAAKQLAERKAWKIAQQKQDDFALKQYGEWLNKNDLAVPPLDSLELAKATVGVLLKNDREMLIQELTSAGLTPTQLSDILTQRISNPPRMELIEVPVTSKSFGGSGMKKFYDEKIVNFARQEAKRLGGTVTQTAVKSSAGEEIPLWKFKFGPKTKEAVNEKGLPLYVLPTAVGLGEVVKEMKKEQESKKSD